MYKKQSKFIGLQMILSFFSMLICFALYRYSYDMPDILFVLPLAFLIVLLFMTIKEKKNFKTKMPIFRFIYLSLVILFEILIVLTYNQELIDEPLLTSVSAIATLPLLYYILICFIRWILAKSKEKQNDVNNVQVKILNSKTGKKINSLPIGYLSVKGYRITITSLFIGMLIIVFGTVIISNNVEINVILLYLIVFALLFLFIFTVILIRNHFCLKIFYEFENKFDYEKFENNIQNVLKEERIHPETRNYLHLALANYIGLFSKEKRMEMLGEVSTPTFPGYLMLYETIKLFNSDLDKEEIISAYEELKLNPVFKQKIYQKMIDLNIKQLKIIYGLIKVDDFKKYVHIKSKTKLSLLNYKISELMYYYFNSDIENNHRIKDELNEFLQTLPNLPLEKERINKYTL